MVKADRQKREQEARNYEKFIERQVGHAVRPYRADGYVNLLNRYGTSRDTTEQYRFENEEAVPDETLVQFYEGNGMFAKIIDAPADECVKHGFELDGVTDEKIIRFYQDGLGELEWEENISTAIKWARLFGGSIAVMLINDGRGLDEPLDWDNIKSIDDIRVYDRSLIQPDYSSMFEYDADDPFRTRGSRLGMPEYYDVFSKWGNFRVHDSRCLVFQNGTLPENCTNSTYQLWGMPEYVRIQRAIRDAEVAHGSAVKLLDRSVQAIYKMKDLAAELATEEGEDRVLRRLQTIDMARGLLNSITIDSEGEEYDFRQFSYTGVAQVIDTTCNYLSAVTNIPQTILFGRSPAGMNATGHGDLENWYSYVERMQRRMVKKNLRYLLSVLFQAGVATGEVDEVPEIDIKFNPLWTFTDQEQAALEQQKASTEQVRAQTAQLYVDMQAIDPSEVRQKLADSADFDIETMLDDYTEEELEENAPKGEEGGEDPMAAMMGGMGGGGPEGAPEGAPGGAPPEMPGGAPQPPEKVSAAEGNEEPDGNAPIAAPDATRLPEDMGDKPQKKEVDQIDSDTEETERSEEAEESKHDNDAKKYGGVGVIVIQDGKVLCARRHNDTGYGLICGPGGSIEGEETAEEAAIREAQEEFGITPLDIFPLGTCDEQVDGSKPMVFVCTRYGGTIECGDLEMVNPRFLTLEALWKAKDDLFVPFRNSLYLLGDKMGFEFDRGEPEEETRFEGDNEPPFYENGLLTGKDLMKQFTHARVKYRNDRKEMKRSFSKASFDGVSGRARVGAQGIDRNDDENWITINGTHVEVDKNSGQVTKGPSALSRNSKLLKKGKDWANKLSKEEKTAIRRITGGSIKSTDVAEKMNNDLRKHGMPTTTGGNKCYDMAKECIDRFEVEEPITVYRGATSTLLGKRGMTIDEIRGCVGITVGDHAFMSASLKPDSYDFQQITYEIKVPSGKGIGAYVADVSKSPEEEEFLFGPHSTYKVMGVKEKDSRIHVLLEWQKEKLDSFWSGAHYKDYLSQQVEKKKQSDRNDDENWKTINGTHVEIDKSTGEMTKGPQALKEVNKKRIQGTKESAPKGTGSSSTDWKNIVKSKREEHKAMKPAKKALLLNDLYGVEDGDLKYEQILEAFQAEDGSLDKMVDDYYDIMEKNGDPTPTKATADQRRDFSSIVSKEYGGKWNDARLGEMQKDTGFTGEEANQVFDALSTWVGNNWESADKNKLDAFVEAAPAYQGTMFRGLHFEPGDGSFEEFMEKVKRGGTMTMNGPASWSSDDFVARTYAHMGDHTYDSVMIRCIKNRTSTPIGYLNRMGEEEVLSSSKAGWTVLDVVEYDDRGGRKAVITVIEQGE